MGSCNLFLSIGLVNNFCVSGGIINNRDGVFHGGLCTMLVREVNAVTKLVQGQL
jgi:hypothetical protein